MLLSILAERNNEADLAKSRRRRGLAASATNLSLRQDKAMTSPKREIWSEADLLAFPTGEHDYFDRKSGLLLTNSDFRNSLGKALSAMSNSGGGHLLIGVEDDGSLTGVPPLRGRTATREWLEQVIPNLVSFPLEDFRVHQVVPSNPSAIPEGRVVVVIDVGDSVLAPHQSEGSRTYYYREGGHSKPAPHFYLETLRNRLVNPTLEASLAEVKLTAAYPHVSNTNSVFVETRLKFVIKNSGRVAAYKWALIVEGTDGAPADRSADLVFRFADFPRGSRSRSSGIRLDDTILPGLSTSVETDFGFALRPPTHDK
ncbi:MAG: ATP-binding protein, partial [Alphaproteobacteria bacterium]